MSQVWAVPPSPWPWVWVQAPHHLGHMLYIQWAAPRPPQQARLFFAWPFCLAWVSAAGGTPYDPTDDLKNLLFSVSLGIATGKGVGEQPSL